MILQVRAWRWTNGIRRHVVTTSGYPAMVRWLERTAGQRHNCAHTMWIEDAQQPAVLVPNRRTSRRKGTRVTK